MAATPAHAAAAGAVLLGKQCKCMTAVQLQQQAVTPLPAFQSETQLGCCCGFGIGY